MSSQHTDTRRGVAVITGGAHGLGLASATKLAAEGYDIALVDMNEAGLAAAAEKLREVSGRDVHISVADVSDEHQVRLARAAIESASGTARVLVNNAGVGGASRLEEIELAEWRRIVDVNLTGTLLCTREFGRGMLSNGGGSIVNLTSILGLTFLPTRAAYSAAKAAIIGLTKAAAVEWASRGVRVNAVAPGYTETEGIRAAVEAGIIKPDLVAERTPLGRLGQAGDVANAVAFLVSPEASYITGHVLVVDGGYTAYGAWWPVAEPAPGTTDRGTVA